MRDNVIPIRAKPTSPWYEIEAKDDGPAQVYIYEEIDPFWGLGAKQFADELNALDANEIDLHINSRGGSVFEGHAIYNTVRDHKATVTTHIDGVAASIASAIALAGDKVVIARNAMFMIHEPFAMTIGGSKDLRKTADVLDKLRDTISKIYVAKSGSEPEEVDAAMAAESWYTAEEAMEAGYADELGPELALAACITPEQAAALGFKRVPEALLASDPPEQSSATVTVELTPELESRLEEIKVMLEDSRDTPDTMDPTEVAQVLRARFEEV